MLGELDLRQSRAGTQLLEPSPRPLAQFLRFRRLFGELDLSAHRPTPAFAFRIARLSDHSSTIAPTRGGGSACWGAPSAVRGGALSRTSSPASLWPCVSPRP